MLAIRWEKLTASIFGLGNVQDHPSPAHATDKNAREPLAATAAGAPVGRLEALWAKSEVRRRWLRRRIYEIMEIGRGEHHASRLFDTFIVTLILLNIAAFVAETVPRLAAAYGPWFHDFEIASVAMFTFEYLLRVWTAVEVPFLSRLPPWKARARLVRSPALIIDLMAILPFYLSQLFNLDLRVLRALRLLRFLKLSRYSPAMHSLLRVLSNERRALMGAGLLLMGAVLFAATGIYFIESAAQPAKFGSVPDAAWWAISTLTTVGYGDVTPITPLGRLFGAIVMVTGLCILALPVAIIAAGFTQEVNRRDFVVTWSLMSRIPLLAELDAREVGQIMPLLHAHNLPPNIEVMAEGSDGRAMYFIASGKVKARSAAGEQTYSQGDVFGVVAMLANDIEQGSFVTASKCRLLKLHREDFYRLEMTNSEIASNLRKVAARHGATRPTREREPPSDPAA
jgi:voltage-gated potassium channel